MAERIRIGVLLSGRGSNMVALAEYRRREERAYDIVLVASNVPEARGLVAARRLGLPTWSHSHKGLDRSEFDRMIDAELRRHEVEIVALAGYMRLLSAEFISGWREHILNIHPSLLPAYKGLDTHSRALSAGEAFAGCSVHLVTEALDDGPVLAQAQVKIRARDTPEALAERVLAEEHQLYPRTLDAYCRNLLETRGASQVKDEPMSSDAALERVRANCLALPETSEKLSHGIPAFAVAGKMFAYFRRNHHGDGKTVVCVKTSGSEEQAMLLETDPGLYSWPAYIGPSGWIAMDVEPADTDWDHVADRIAQSWEYAAPRRMLEAGGR